MWRPLALLLLLWPGAAGAAETVVFGGPAVDFLPVFVAVDDGIFARHGLDVTVQILPNGGLVPAALQSGSIQVGGVSTPILLQAAQGGLAIGVIAGATVAAGGDGVGSVLGRSGVALGAPADFLGKRVAVSSVGSFLHVLFRQWLADRGVDPDRVQFVETPFPRMGDLLRAEQVDAAAAVEPFASRIRAAGLAAEVAPILRDYPDDLLVNAYAVTADWFAAHRAAAAGFRAALAEAIGVIAADPARARAGFTRYLKLPPAAAAAQALSAYRVAVVPAQIALWQRIGLRQGMIERAGDPAGLIFQ